ncbi:MAG TPA: helix-turn-helix transcriptional regulator [bacterium]|nr:helix-turn-helix transcriptional regulator [bacterium]
MTVRVRARHSPDPNVANVAALIGDRTRAAMLFALLDGGALPASELAYRGAASPQAASAHLRKLVDGRLLAVAPVGRQRLYRLTSRDVARAIEALLLIAPPPRIVALTQHSATQRLRAARVCYDHLAGRLGVAITDALLARRLLRAGGAEFSVTRRGERFFEGLGIDVPALRGRRRPLARPCMDWTERRAHLAGSLGMQLRDCFVANDWVTRHARDRSLTLTERGRRAVARLFGLGAVPTQSTPA